MKPFGSNCSQYSTSFDNSFRGSALRLPSPSHPKNTDALISADAKLDRVKTMGTRGRINAI